MVDAQEGGGVALGQKGAVRERFDGAGLGGRPKLLKRGTMGGQRKEGCQGPWSECSLSRGEQTPFASLPGRAQVLSASSQASCSSYNLLRIASNIALRPRALAKCRYRDTGREERGGTFVGIEPDQKAKFLNDLRQSYNFESCRAHQRILSR
ncbi:hypothetical protein [Phenylobacterium sp.]|uniref:hypothetical protein n=1 Tax=Phenylobacterium sp. TaxID=1871053 RepID=UPI0035B2E930